MTEDCQRPRDVLVLHTEPIVAAGLAAALRRSALFSVRLGEEQSAVGHRPGCGPDVVVSDYATGIQLASDLRSGKRWAMLSVGLVVLAGKPREIEINAAISQGVLGYLVTGCSVEELWRAVQAAAGGRRYLCRDVAQRIAGAMTSESLTAREREILRLVAKGNGNKGIAIRLDIGVGTVKAHVRRIMCKLNAVSRTEAASIASTRGLLEDNDGFAALQ